MLKKILFFFCFILFFMFFIGVRVSFSQVSDLGNKIHVLQNGESKDKIDLLFIPANISDISYFEAEIEGALNRSTGSLGLFEREPFKKYKDKFNVAYIDKNINESGFECGNTRYDGYFLSKSLFLCDGEKVKSAYKQFEPDYIVVVYDRPGGASFDLISHIKIGNLRSYIFIHELMHQFGIADEYPAPYYAPCSYSSDLSCFTNYQEVASFYPNFDTLGCPKWCSSYDLSKDDVLTENNNFCNQFSTPVDCRGNLCEWFNLEHPFLSGNCVSRYGTKNIGINCDDGFECLMGGDYGQLAFNSGRSLMNTGAQVRDKFNQATEDHLESLLECCYPRSESAECQQFRNQFINIPVDVIPPLRLVYNKIAHCGEEESVSCVDSDGGKNPNIRGTTQDQFMTATDSCGLYYHKILFEYSCFDGRLTQEELKCSSTCVNGACVDEKEKTFSLTPRWNLISFPIFPLGTTKMDSIFYPLVQDGKYFEVWVAEKDTSERGYHWLAYAYNDIDSTFFDLDPAMSYFILVKEPVTLTIKGVAQNFTLETWLNSLDLRDGWNMVGFPFDNSLSIIEALKLIEQDYTKVAFLDSLTNTYKYFYNPTTGVPEYLNNFTQFEPGKGYWVKIGN